MTRLLDTILTLSIPTVILLHLSLAPFTKVEESFNIQAIHDIQTYGLPFSTFLSATPGNTTTTPQETLHQYDHIEFPGSVPRTFVGAILIALIANPFMKYYVVPLGRQQIVRAVLGMLNALALMSLRNAIAKAFGRTAGNWFVLLQVTQFHVMYYASRTLPNTYAFALTTLSLGSFVTALDASEGRSVAKRQHAVSLGLLTLAGVVFRAEIAVLLGAQALYVLITKRASLIESVIPAGLLGLPVALALTVSVDSVFWRHWPTWPEWTGFYYNTVQGQASNWGVSPWHYYASNALPKLLMSSLLLIPLALVKSNLRVRVLPLLIPSTVFVALYSFLPHKEWRFVVYTIPAYTTVAALSASYIWTRRSKSTIYRLASVALLAFVLLNTLVSTLSLLISNQNYPGGLAITKLRTHLWSDRTSPDHPTIFADNLVCQTGLTRYLEFHPPWSQRCGHAHLEQSYHMLNVSKSEEPSERLDPIWWQQFEYVLTEDPARVIGSFEIVDVVYGWAGLFRLKPGYDSLQDLAESEDEDDRAEGLRLAQSVLFRHPVLDAVEKLGRRFTRGYWVRPRFEPKIYILRSEGNIAARREAPRLAEERDSLGLQA